VNPSTGKHKFWLFWSSTRLCSPKPKVHHVSNKTPQRERERERQRDKETERQRDRETWRKRDREIERHRDREIDKIR
jgi:hypothetical protein